MLYPAQLNRNFERQIGHKIFVKTGKTEYLSNQLTYAHFDWKFIFPIKFGTSEEIFIFLDFQSVSNFWNSYCYVFIIHGEFPGIPLITFVIFKTVDIF